MPTVSMSTVSAPPSSAYGCRRLEPDRAGREARRCEEPDDRAQGDRGDVGDLRENASSCPRSWRTKATTASPWSRVTVLTTAKTKYSRRTPVRARWENDQYRCT